MRLIAFILFSNLVFAVSIPKAFEAKFLEVDSQSLRGEKRYPVLMKYKFKGHIYYEIQKEDAQSLYVCNPTTTWFYKPPFIKGEPGELSVGKSNKYCYSKIFDTLSSANPGFKLFKRTSQGKVATYVFSKEVQKQMGMTKVVLEFKEQARPAVDFASLLKLSLYKSGSDRPVVLELKQLEKEPKFNSKTFHFTPPKNTIKKVLR